MPTDSQMQQVLDQFAEFGVPPIESFTPHAARNTGESRNITRNCQVRMEAEAIADHGLKRNWCSSGFKI